jgi:5-(carboxyamino)imidazole ribonucleotide synthase
MSVDSLNTMRLGILGGGQLGRMTALAAAALGIRSHIFCPEADPPAAQVTPFYTRADYADTAALDTFAASVDVVTLEFENIPVSSLAWLAARVPVHPGPQLLAITQDRLAEKEFSRQHGVPTAPCRAVDSLPALQAAVTALGLPAILKTRRMGYDGKGQVVLQTRDDVEPAWQQLGPAGCILEGFMPFFCEVSIIAARTPQGQVRLFPLTENRHRDGILRESIAPAPVPSSVALQAADIAYTLVTALEVTGLLAIELFLMPDGTLALNEMAPRPHNSGHWTLNGCVTSQFEQLVRAVCGLPLGDTGMTTPQASMVNLLGEDVLGWQAALATPRAHVHLYGKAKIQPGRKLGHVNYC